MPIYEYFCKDCRNQVDFFFRSFADTETKKAVCPTCKGTNLERLVSKVSVLHPGAGNSSTVDSTTTSPGKDAETDKELAKVMQQAQNKAGQNLGYEFKEVATRLERGETASSIEKSLRKRAGQQQQTH